MLSAETDGWVRMFVDLGPAMNDLLVRLAERDVASHYVAHILATFPAAQVTNQPAPRPSPTSLIEPLSERELEVLTLLAQRLSNKEISAQLFIAPATVKQHTLSIYRKLAVNSRRQAVTRATDIGLLATA